MHNQSKQEALELMQHVHLPHGKPPSARPISDILKCLPSQFHTSNIALGILRDTLASNSYGIVLLVLALPNLIPLPAPGLSAILGTPLLFVTLQWMVGRQKLWLPRFIERRTIKRAYLQRACKCAVPWVEHGERVIQPRLTVLTAPPATRIIALLCFLMSMFIMLPIPFGNALPSLAICLYAIGTLQHDGWCIIFGTLAAIVSCFVVFVISGAIFLSISDFL